LDQAIALLRRALDTQPTFAAAHACLSQCYRLYLNYGFGYDNSLLSAARTHADRAIRLDPESADAHVALAMLLRDHDFEGTITELRSAVTLDPGHVEARHYLAHTYLWRGYYQRSLAEEQQALALDPLHPTSRSLLSRILVFCGRKEEALQHIETLKEDNVSRSLYSSSRAWIAWWYRDWSNALAEINNALLHDPNNVYALSIKVEALCRLGRWAEARTSLGDMATPGDDSNLLPLRGAVYREEGNRELAEKTFDESRQMIMRRSGNGESALSAVDYYNLAYVDAVAGDLEKFIVNIQRAIDNGLGHWADLQDRPTFDEMRKDPRVRKLIADLMATQQALDFIPD
jgi:tetratricopeptide (TPR) repeat protein